MVYLDYAANAPVDEEVLATFNEISKKYFANPNATHKLGKEAKEIIDKSTENIAKIFNVLPEEIIYTSGASESNNLAIKGICERYKSKGKHIITTPLEHNSITAPLSVMQKEGFEVEVMPVKKDGLVDIDALKEMLREDTILVSIIAVDSEIGLKQPIEEIGKILKDYPNTFFHTDASQAIGKVDIDLTNVDLMTIAPHKFYGINGFGALIKKKNVSLVPIINGGKSTTIYRSGTPVTSMVVALDKALEIAYKNMKERYSYIKSLNERVKNELSKYKNVHIISTENSVPHTLNIAIDNVKSLDFAKKLESYDVYISTKTSCCPSETPSKLVYALTNNKSLALSSLRISFSHLTTQEEINIFLDAFDKVLKEMTNGKI